MHPPPEGFNEQAAPRLQLLGPPCAEMQGRLQPIERKDAALLALLALDGRVSRSAAASMLWPDVPAAQSRTSLRQRLYRLRRAAGRDVVCDDGALVLAPGVEHDLGPLAERLRADPDAAAGELLAGCEYDDCPELAARIADARQRWSERRADALATLADETEAAGHLGAALRYGQRLMRQEPLLEEAYRRVMRLHYLRGDRAAALACYEQCVDVLMQRLDTAPDAQTRKLARLVESTHTDVVAVQVPITVLRPPRMIGRDAQLAQARAALAAGRVVVVSGEAGIGKTRLFDAWCALEPRLLASGARAGDARMPYAVLARVVRAGHLRHGIPDDPWVREALAALLPELGPAPARIDTLRLHQAVARTLDTWSADGLPGIVVDDLHHADPGSVEALLALFASRSRDGPSWALGVRTGEAPAGFEAWSGSAEPGTVEQVGLGPLDADGVADLLGSLGLVEIDPAAWTAPLLAHTGGNPLFILETLRTLIAGRQPSGPISAQRLPMPAAIGTLIQARLERLSAPALRIARVAALAGQDFSAGLAAHVLECHPVDIVEPWAELARAQVIRDDGFAHDLIADTMLRSIPAPVARLLHARLADTLQEVGAPPASVAYHRCGAEQWEAAGLSYVEAAQQALKASRRGDEIELREQSAACFERAGLPQSAFSVRCDGVEALLIVRGVAAAQALSAQLIASAGSAEERARALAAQANASLMAADHSAGTSAARESLNIAEMLGLPALGFEARRLLAIGLAQSGEAEQALQTMEPVRAPIGDAGSIEQRQRFWSDYAYVLNAGGLLDRTVLALEQAIALAREAGDYAEMATLTANLATVEGNFGRPARALQRACDARALADPLGHTDGPAGGVIDMTIAQYCVPLGRYREALQGLEGALQRFDRDNQITWRAVTRNHLARALLDLGQYAKARQALDYPPSPVQQVPARRALLWARCSRLMGGRDDAALAEARHILDKHGDPYMTMLVTLEASHAQDADEAAASCAEVQARAERLQFLGIATTARLLQAHHLHRGGVHEKALLLVADATDRIERHAPTDLYLPTAWWIASLARRAGGDAEGADDCLRRACDWILHTALPEVPDYFRDSFLERNETNRDVLAAARQSSHA
ncbi:MAG TPA: AAA family ATPase [Albitalea sp.]|uniref:ATP-binding protein n=1 Tax=Piscinibacter sp. TaxID=1903157 RepID=UPI002ED2335A